jgi:hypothetical protein
MAATATMAAHDSPCGRFEGHRAVLRRLGLATDATVEDRGEPSVGEHFHREAKQARGGFRGGALREVVVELSEEEEIGRVTWGRMGKFVQETRGKERSGLSGQVGVKGGPCALDAGFIKTEPLSRRRHREGVEHQGRESTRETKP